MALQHLRSSTANKRPTPAAMSDGQLAMNTNLASPGLFLKDSNGDLVKVGPVHVGTTAPNATPAAGGQAGNSVGEQWLDTSSSRYVFKIWDGTAWRTEDGEFVNSSGDTMTGALVMDNQQQVRFREASGNGTNFIALQAPASVASDKTITLPDVTGTVVTTGDTGTVTSTMILDGTILNADVNASAAIAGTKIAPDFGSQTIATTGVFSHALGAAATPSVTFTGDTNTGIYSPGADQVAISTNGTGRLFVQDDGDVSIGQSTGNSQLLVKGSTAARTVSQFIANDTTTTTMAVWERSDGAVSSRLIYDGTGLIKFGTSTAHDLTLDTSGSQRLRLTSTGTLNFVGAGTAGSTQAVSFNGSAPVDSLVITSGGLVGLGTSSPSQKLQIATGNVQIDSNYGFIWDNSTTGIYGNSSPSVLQFYTGNAERMRVTSTGVGIGTTSPSNTAGFSQQLELAGTLPCISINQNNGSFTTRKYSLGVDSLGGFGIWDNTSNSYRFYTNTSGNVGIGTSSPSSSLVVSNGGANGIEFGPVNGDIFTYNRSTSAYTNTQITCNEFVVRTNGSNERARIDSSGRLLVGTSSAVNTINYAGLDFTPRSQVVGAAYDEGALAVVRTQTSPFFFLCSGASGTNVVSGNGLGSLVFTGYHTTKYYTGAVITAEVDGTPGANDMPGRLVFSTAADGSASPTERMRIGNNGQVSIGVNSVGAFARASLLASTTSGSHYGVHVNSTDTTNGAVLVEFTAVTTEVGNITTNGTSSVSYNTTSDYRLKENIAPVLDGITRLQQLKPSRFNFISNPNKTVDGFIAHEAQAVVPECVTGTKDEVDADGNPVYQGIDQSKLVPLLTAALQEAIAKIEALETRLSALEGA